MRRFIPLLALLLAACAAAAPEGPNFYLLDAPLPEAAPASDAAEVGLRELALPLYARRPQMAVATESGALLVSDDHRWAEEPARAATRLVARALAARRGAPVYADPWPQGARPEIVATVEVDRFVGALGGEIALEGQITLARLAARNRAETATFSIRAPVAGQDHAALAAAYGAALDELAAELARRLTAF